MTLNEFLGTYRVGDMVDVSAECADGFRISIQASRWHYATPRVTCAVNRYTEFELGYPSRDDATFEEWAECEGGKIAPYVPREVVEALLAAHGGIRRACYTV
jgi:hypothetical protein